VFANGRLVADGKPTLPRPDLAAEYGKASLNATFALAGSSGTTTTPSESDVEVFAVVDNRESALEQRP
jgi:hypothetical protein